MDVENGTLVANVVTTVSIDAFLATIRVISHGDNGEEIWYTVDGSTPTVNGHNVMWTNGISDAASPSYTSATTVKLLSTAAVGYTVRGL